MSKLATPKLNGRRASARNAAARPPVTGDEQRQVSNERIRIHKRSVPAIRGLKAETLVTQIEQFNAGYLRELAQTMEQCEQRDDTLQTVAPKRRKAIARHGFTIGLQDFDTADAKLVALAERQKEALHFFYNNLIATSAVEQNLRGGFTTLVRQMATAIGMRYAVHEIVWIKRGKYYTAEFWHCPLQFFENTTGRLRFIEQELGTLGVDMEPGAWLVTVGDGIGIASAIAWWFKNAPMRDWVGYCDKFGFPGVHGKTGAAKGSPEWNNMVEAVRNFALDWAAVTSMDEAIELIEAANGQNAPFEPLVDRMDRAMTRLWRGGDMGTMGGGKKGDVGAQAQQAESDTMEEDDAAWISEQLQQVDRLVLDYTFGQDVPALAYVQVRVPEQVDVEKEVKINDHLTARGIRLSKKAELERFGRTEAEEEEDAFGAPPKPEAPSMPGEVSADPKLRAKNESRLQLTRTLTESLVQTGGERQAAALARDLAALQARVAALQSIEDETLLAAQLAGLRHDLPQILEELPEEAAAAIYDTLSAALLNGLAERKTITP